MPTSFPTTIGPPLVLQTFIFILCGVQFSEKRHSPRLFSTLRLVLLMFSNYLYMCVMEHEHDFVSLIFSFALLVCAQWSINTHFSDFFFPLHEWWSMILTCWPIRWRWGTRRRKRKRMTRTRRRKRINFYSDMRKKNIKDLQSVVAMTYVNLRLL